MGNISSLYGIEVYNAAGTLLADLTGTATLESLIVERNRAGSARFSIDLFVFERFCRSLYLNPTDILNVNVNEVRIRRGGRYLFAGQISARSPQLSGDQGTISVDVSGWLSLLGYRYTAATRTFTNIDAGTIAGTLITETQQTSGSYDTNKDFGIRSNSIQTSLNRTVSFQYKNIQDAIIALAEMYQGFDFEITYDKKFNVYYPAMGADRSADLLFEYPKNIKSISTQVNGPDMVNQDTVRGSGTGSAQTIVVTNDTTFQAIYKSRERIDDFSDENSSTILTAYGNEVVRVGKNINNLELPQIEIDGNQQPYVGSFWLGDRVTLNVRNLNIFKNIANTVYKIDSIEVKVDQNLQETIILKLSLP